MKMTKYVFVKILYDNGIEEEHTISGVSIEEINEIASMIAASFRTSANGYLQISNEGGLPIIVNLNKVLQVEFKE